MIKIEFSETCNCEADLIFPDGNKPEYFLDRQEAIRAYAFARQNKSYFGVHLDGKHILTVHIKGFCRCYICTPK